MRALRPSRLLPLVLLASAGCAARGPDLGSPLAGPQRGWNRIAGGSGTGCVQDSTYAFFFRPGRERRLAIFFQGGGGCWNSQNCDLQGRHTFTNAHVNFSPEDPSRMTGILELSNPRNPIRDYSIVFVPYCTADAFLGARTVTYSTPGTTDTPERSFQIRHRGMANAEDVLAWVFAHFTEPNLVLVTGVSAGAIPTPVYATRIAQHYPRARVVQLGDAAGGYRARAIPGILALWGATRALQRDDAYRAIDSAAMTFEGLYVIASRATPRVTFTQYNSAEDTVQLAYLSRLGERGVRLQQALAENHADIRRANPRFRTYTGPGQGHGILRRPEFYTLTVDGIAFRDWVADLLDGHAVPDVGRSLLVASPQSSQESKLVFVTDRLGRDAPDEIYVMNADGTGEKRLTVTTTGNNLFPEWSPDGRRIAFGSNRTGVSQIYVMNADGTGLTPLTTAGGAHPCWSPDGKRIAFTGPGVEGAPDILVINVDGSGLVNLTQSPTNEQRPDWSPDGRRIAFNGNRDGNAEIYAIKADGTGEPVRLTFESATDMAPEWSPDGQKIAFESARDGNREIYVMNADGTHQIRLTVDPRMDAFPSWSPDGRRIVFQRQIMVIPDLGPPNGSELFTMNADGTEQTQLTHRTPASFSAFASWVKGRASPP